MNKVKLLVMDVDGTLTDGGVYMGPFGETLKRFYIRDGMAIKHFLPAHDIVPAIITGRKSRIVSNRCKELGIKICIQGCQDKVTALKGLVADSGFALQDVAYIGDDLNDIECMKISGVKGCPADAAKEVASLCDFVSSCKGGNGAVRDFIEWIIGDEE